jgi:hypothetical protein
MNFYLCIWFKMYKLRDWVDEKRLKGNLSLNERAVEYLENHEILIDNCEIFSNENAIHIIEKRIHYLEHVGINYNKNAVNFLRNNRQYIDYRVLCGKEHGIEFVDELIKKNELEKIDWSMLSRNPAAMHILNDPKYYKYIDWGNILHNKNAVKLVKNNLHRIVIQYWYLLCEQPHLIEIIEQHMNNINWYSLSVNYNAMHILEKNIEKINIEILCYNKNGFQLLLQLNHVFDDDNVIYDKNIVLEYFDYCENNNKEFNLIQQLSEHCYTEKHMEFLKHNNDYYYLSMNPNIFEYDYKRMRETRQSLLWYNDIKK